ncbi:DUF3810 domain-containing protein [Parasediminibacterium sp. JCM 36343]|uniref:DUF3810 domain-containing protein n=1 Tax=Parasediminibacterium sp. JCM 36343 TaxID=3374279 RepID=UPI00397A31FB
MGQNKKNNYFLWSIALEWAVPALLIVLLKAVSHYPHFIENVYSTGFYTYIAYLQRVLFGWLPFSIGDVMYSFLWLLLIFYVGKVIWMLVKKQYSWALLGMHAKKLLKTCLWVYIVFNVLWGLNYTRLGIASQLKLDKTSYTDEELKDLACDLAEQLNETRAALGDSNYIYPKGDALFAQAYSGYQKLAPQFQFLQYKHLSVKQSLLSWLISYAGYSGYYDPFSGEAQVNRDMPGFVMPFVTCHEMAHQLGYASESEANFVGYLACMHSDNLLLKYSGLYELFTTANGELLERDFWPALLNYKSLSPLVKRDRKIYREYILGKQNNLEPVIKNVYDQYLKANQQRGGINSYNEVVGWLIAYRKKYEKAR